MPACSFEMNIIYEAKFMSNVRTAAAAPLQESCFITIRQSTLPHSVKKSLLHPLANACLQSNTQVLISVSCTEKHTMHSPLRKYVFT